MKHHRGPHARSPAPASATRLAALLQRIVAACAVSGVYGAPCAGEPRVWSVPLVEGGRAVTGDAGSDPWTLRGNPCAELCGNPRAQRCRYSVTLAEPRSGSTLVVRCQSDLPTPMDPEQTYGGTTCSWQYGSPSAASCRVEWLGDGKAVADWTIHRRDSAAWTLSGEQCVPVCEGRAAASCHIRIAEDQPSVTCMEAPPGAGRRPAGLRVRRRPCSSLGDYFARVAHLEAASVEAFEILATELAMHGAPARLIRGAQRSARDERRHARVMGALARRHGGRPVAPVVRRARTRALEALARENAVEGCVRETFGALLCAWQAARASDPLVRRAMSGIAKDETRHATLAWQIASWVEPRLGEVSKRRVEAAKRRAVRALERSLGGAEPGIAHAAGLPDAASARAMLRELDREMWQAVAGTARTG